jgi:DNA-binding MarR family transcriptional regulator
MAKTKAATQDDVLEHLQALMFGLRAQLHDTMRAQAAAGEQELAPMEARVLQHLARHPGWTQGELVAHSRRDKAQVTRLIQQLEARGLLTREPDAQDRRKLRLHLTAAGLAAQHGLQAQRKRLAARLVADLQADELNQLGNLLARMRANLDTPAQ